MHWSCPHCGISLTVTEDTLGTGWSFSKCYKCGGFALIRRAEVNIIKVDKAPPGERVILPEASKDPTTGMLSESATQKLARHLTNKPKLEPQVMPNSPPPINYTPPLTPKAASFDISTAILPNPLPETPTSDIRSKTVPIGIAATAILAATSGVYLFIQSQTLWQRAREFVRDNSKLTAAKEVSSASPNEKEVIPPPSLLTTDKIPEAQTVAIQETRPIITDQVQQSAMAPVKPAAAPEPEKTVKPAPPARPAMMVKIRSKRANIHSGPGMEFPVVGTATPQTSYIIADWNNRWFKLSANNRDLQKGIGWVRNDLVQILPEGSSSGIAAPHVNPLH